ncbi:MAG: CPBP family intramembrane glutamic endopeptidase [Planctomycetota bacterium]|jgi:membrane protease YdiL (CAAX protease family)
MNKQNSSSPKRSFSLWLYLLIVFSLSWPFQIIAAIWGIELLPRFSLHATSMFMVTVGTFIAGRYVFRDGFAGAGWRWGKPKHYLAVIGLALLLWAVPTIADLALGTVRLPDKVSGTQLIWILVFLTGFIPCFGEEFGWRGYMLPRLAQRYSPRKAVIIHGVIWWAWHLPVLIGIGVWAGIAVAPEMGLSVGLSVAITVAATALGSAIPAILHGVVFAYIWTRSRSLAVATVYHTAFDGVRDSIQTTIGAGPIAGFWAVALLVILGIVFLWKGNWKNLEAYAAERQVAESETELQQ